MLVQVLGDVADALLHQRRHRIQSLGTRLLYNNILHYGGPIAHEFLSRLLLGPDVSTTRRQRMELLFEFMTGFIESAFVIAKQILHAYGLTGCPLLAAEDGTALQIRVDLDFNAEKREVIVGSESMCDCDCHVATFTHCFRSLYTYMPTVAWPICIIGYLECMRRGAVHACVHVCVPHACPSAVCFVGLYLRPMRPELHRHQHQGVCGPSPGTGHCNYTVPVHIGAAGAGRSSHPTLCVVPRRLVGVGHNRYGHHLLALHVAGDEHSGECLGLGPASLLVAHLVGNPNCL